MSILESSGFDVPVEYGNKLGALIFAVGNKAAANHLSQTLCDLQAATTKHGIDLHVLIPSTLAALPLVANKQTIVTGEPGCVWPRDNFHHAGDRLIQNENDHAMFDERIGQAIAQRFALRYQSMACHTPGGNILGGNANVLIGYDVCAKNYGANYFTPHFNVSRVRREIQLTAAVSPGQQREIKHIDLCMVRPHADSVLLGQLPEGFGGMNLITELRMYQRDLKLNGFDILGFPFNPYCGHYPGNMVLDGKRKVALVPAYPEQPAYFLAISETLRKFGYQSEPITMSSQFCQDKRGSLRCLTLPIFE